jgi:hypothetical protein
MAHIVKLGTGILGKVASGHLRKKGTAAWRNASTGTTNWGSTSTVDPAMTLQNIHDDPTSGSYWGAAVSAAISGFASGSAYTCGGSVGVGGPYNHPGEARATARVGGQVKSFSPLYICTNARIALNVTARVGVFGSAPSASQILNATEQTPSGGYMTLASGDVGIVNQCARDKATCYISVCIKPTSTYPYSISLAENSITNDTEDPIEPTWWPLGPIQPGVTHTWYYIADGTTEWSASFTFGAVQLYY